MKPELQHTKVVIVGAGPSGIGCAALLKQMGLTDDAMRIFEAKQIGSTFKAWPKEMKMITPSFPSNGFHQTDLNAITPDTSPAFSIGKEHLTGEDYATYLQNVVKHYDIKVEENQKVIDVLPQGEDDDFLITLASGEQIATQYLIWAGGEFSSPKKATFGGSELCTHNSEIDSWANCDADHYAVIGCYESGVDAAYNLASLGKKVTLIDASYDQADTYDPSRVLSPYTAERLASLVNTQLVELEQCFEVNQVIETSSGYELISMTGDRLSSQGKPINCTGFNTHLGPVSDLFDLDSEGFPLINKFDESTICRNLFLTGPKLVHGEVLLCFIYKFRGRFTTPCSIIATELDLDLSILKHYQQAGMLLQDLSCCEDQQCFC
ncbi:NAD(P)-binding domain-containing protein [Catenovulum sp. SM1970]|uniref:NAD(P)/FAD-dependent oxidoreductase n=1 Tax=Marinifaba aquimaris TaxID=2741323 RepID=UPI0015721B94|nr:NAD(P)/FAD-dependent oxidoreductase [Marinifaba aquimaris]NTS77149.1 NAD(P)-binding domain-containing protein [Marinifaba aquimaris]